MKIIYDLDGVLRDLNGYLKIKYNLPIPKKWVWTIDNKNIYDWIKKDNYLALVYAPTTEYFRTIEKNAKNIEIWTHQPEEWQPYTKLWLDNHLINYTINYLTTDEKQKLLYSEKGLYLVEDSPNFTDYRNILLIDTPYNQEVNCENRIFKPEDLLIWIERENRDHDV